MHFSLENPHQYFRNFQEVEKLSKYRTYIESLDRDDMPENKPAIKALTEGIDAIMEGLVTNEMLTKYITSPVKKLMSQLGDATKEERGDYLNTEALKLASDGVDDIENGNEEDGQRKIDRAKSILTGITAPYVAAYLNKMGYVRNENFSQAKVEDIFSEMMTEISGSFDRYFEEEPTDESGEVTPFVVWAYQIVKSRVSKYINQGQSTSKVGKHAKKWLPDHKYGLGMRVFYDGETYVRYSDDGEPNEMSDEQLTIPPDSPHVSDYWKVADTGVDEDTAKLTKPVKDLEDMENNAYEAPDADEGKFGTTDIDNDPDYDEEKYKSAATFKEDEIKQLKAKLAKLNKINVDELEPSDKEKVASAIKITTRKLEKAIMAKTIITEKMGNASAAELHHAMLAPQEKSKLGLDKESREEIKNKLSELTDVVISQNTGANRREIGEYVDQFIEHLAKEHDIDPELAKAFVHKDPNYSKLKSAAEKKDIGVNTSKFKTKVPVKPGKPFVANPREWQPA